MGPPERRWTQAASFPASALLVCPCGLREIGVERRELRQLAVELALQREGLAEAFFVAGEALVGFAAPGVPAPAGPLRSGRGCVRAGRSVRRASGRLDPDLWS